MSENVELSEAAALVRREAAPPMSYTEEGGSMLRRADDDAADEHQELDYVDSDTSLLAQFHEDAIKQAGFGPFQWMLLGVVGLGLAADTIEIFVVPYLLPSAEVELCITGPEKTWLAVITFMGMMVGGVVWGNLADRLGRRRTLVSALSVNAVFSAVAAFMPTYGTFMTARFCSGVGIGGSFPIVFPYTCEFLGKAQRGRYLSWLLIFWACGGIFTVLMAWAIIPRTGLRVILEDKEHFSAWHQFLLVCCLPSVFAVVGLLFLPESPRYLLEAGREVEAMMVYQHIHRVNHLRQPAAQYQLSELEVPSKGGGVGHRLHHVPPPSPGKSVLADVTYSLETFWSSFLQLFVPPHLRVTLVLLILWFTAAFAYFGLKSWFPEYLKLLKETQYDARARNIVRYEYNGDTFNSSLENVHYFDSHFVNVQFKNLILNHVTFQNCSIENSVFSNVKSSRTFFRDSYIARTRFIDTDLYKFRFERCETVNSSFLSMEARCRQDFDYNIYLDEVFQENLVGQVAVLHGTLLAGLLVDRLGRAKMIGLSMFLSSVSAFFIWFLDTTTGVIIFEAVFNFIFISGWNAIDVATTESYPTHMRTTGFGFLSSTCRVAGVLGNLSFGYILGSSRALPMLATAAVLLIGCIASIRLPEMREALV